MNWKTFFVSPNFDSEEMRVVHEFKMQLLNSGGGDYYRQKMAETALPYSLVDKNGEMLTERLN